MSLDVYLISTEPIIREQSSGIFIRENGATKEISVEEWNKKHPDTDPVYLPNYMTAEVETNEVYSANITHNLGTMAGEAGLYEVLWRPHRLKEGYNISNDDYKAECKFEDENIIIAKELIEPLREGLHKLKLDPDKYKAFNPDNGWGDYDGLVNFVEKYLNACYKYPNATVNTDR